MSCGVVGQTILSSPRVSAEELWLSLGSSDHGGRFLRNMRVSCVLAGVVYDLGPISLIPISYDQGPISLEGPQVQSRRE